MTLRVAIVGANVNRVAKVLSLVLQQNDDGTEAAKDVVFLPIVAAFGSYEDENGAQVKYLANVTYHGDDGREKGTSLAPFYDEALPDDEEDKDKPPIAIFAIGCGIEDEKDIQQIRTFLATLGGDLQDVVLECVRPNSEYSTMKEETDAYRQLDSESKLEATEQQTMGPGKMANFIHNLVRKATEEKVSNDEVAPEKGVAAPEGVETAPVAEEAEEEPTPFIDPTKNRYACRMCRQVLFGDDDLQDPPHVPKSHMFNRRKDYGIPGSSCQSYFLGFGLTWMGDTSPPEGKFGCPYCNAKLGNWKWAGAQCSCGTWVTPAIQVPGSKVDIILPPQVNDGSEKEEAPAPVTGGLFVK